MKAKEYLHQAYRLDKRIQSNIEGNGKAKGVIDQCFPPLAGAREYKTGRHTDAFCFCQIPGAEFKNYKSRLMMR